MKVLSDPIQVHSLVRKWRETPKSSIGFVPTMGALHEGHMELVRTSKKQNKRTVVSIYVNPLQFGPKEDLASYPRTMEKDLALLKREGADLVFTPSDKEMYPEGFSTEVKVSGPIVEELCAPFRPGHFNGVATVVLKLLNVVQPHHLYLGQKDAQQAVLLKKVIRDLGLEVKAVICPIVREHDGLAMSSRNKRLDIPGRRAASVLYRALKAGKSVVNLGETNTKKVLAEVTKVILSEHRVRLQYLQAVDPQTLTPVEKIKSGTLIALAAYLDKVRLIDNIIV